MPISKGFILVNSKEFYVYMILLVQSHLHDKILSILKIIYLFVVFVYNEF